MKRKIDPHLICPFCSIKCKTLGTATKHFKKNHINENEILFKRFICYGSFDEKFCLCGCKMTISPRQYLYGYKWKHGHSVRVNENPGKKITTETKNKISESHKNGHKNRTIKSWNKGLTVEDERVRKYTDKRQHPETIKKTGEKISKALKGIPKSPEHIRKMMLAFRNRKNYKRSKQEQLIEIFLNKHNIKYKSQFRIYHGSQHHKSYDFLIIKDNIIIEYNGSYWHCDIRKFPSGPINQKQLIVVNNDKFKKELAEKSGYKLIYIWEFDVIKNGKLNEEILLSILRKNKIL